MTIKKTILHIFILGIFAISLTGCGSASKSTDSPSDIDDTPINTVTPDMSIEEVKVNATFVLSDGTPITAKKVEIARKKGGFTLSNLGVSVSQNAVSEPGLFLEEGAYQLAIILEQNGKTYVWATTNITVTLKSHLNLGVITLEELKPITMIVSVPDELDTIYFKSYSMNIPSILSGSLGDAKYSLTFNETTQVYEYSITMNLPLGYREVRFEGFTTILDGVKTTYQSVLFSGTVTTETTSFSTQTIVKVLE